MAGATLHRDQGAEGPRSGGYRVSPRPGVVLGALLVFLATAIHAGTIAPAGQPGSRLPEDELCCWSNPAVVGPDQKPALLGRFYDSAKDGYRETIRPLSVLFLRAEHSAFGPTAAGYRLVQLLLLAVSGVLLFLLLAAQWGSIPGAVFGALLLVAHPLSVPAVAGVAGVSGLLALVLLLGAFWITRDDRNVPGACGLVLLALLSNEMAFVAIPVVGAWAWSRSRPGSRFPSEGFRRSVWADPRTAFVVGSGLAGLAVLIYRAVVEWTLPEHLKIARAVESWSGIGLGRRLLVGLAGIFESLRLIVYPYPIGYANDYLVASALTPLRAGLGLLLLGAMAWLLVRTLRRRDPVAFWLAMVLLPAIGVSGIIFPTGAILPPRALLFLVPGVAGLSLWAARWVLARRTDVALRVALPVLGVAIIGLAGWRTLARTSDYTNWERLVQRQTLEFPRSAQGWYDLGNIRLSRGQLATARSAYEEALAQRPDAWEAWVNLGVAYYGQEERGLAMRAFTAAVEGTAEKKAYRVVHARARFHQGLVYMTQAKNVEAARCFEDMLAVFPDHLYSHANVGIIYTNSEYLDDRSMMHLERALQLETEPARRTVLQEYRDRVVERQNRKDRQRERMSGGESLGTTPGDSMP